MSALTTGAGLAVAVFAGSWFTAQAVLTGNLPGTFAWFVGSILLGTYYLYLHRMARA